MLSFLMNTLSATQQHSTAQSKATDVNHALVATTNLCAAR